MGAIPAARLYYTKYSELPPTGYHPAIISTITCAALMRIRVESVRRSITIFTKGR